MRLVENWQQGWRWFSNWAFVIVAFLAAEPLSPEIVALLPHFLQDKIITLVAIAGLISRFISQSKQGAYREY